MGGKIDCYLDIASLYSYFAFLELQKNRELLASHNVEVEFHPVLLGAINVGSGNRPPWTLPAKAAYGAFDARRSVARHANLKIQVPKDLMQAAKTVIPLRALHYIKRTHPEPTFLSALHYLFHLFWTPPNTDLTSAAAVAAALASVPAGFAGTAAPETNKTNEKPTRLLFTPDEVQRIMAAAATEEMKQVLKSATQAALDRGAFGAPWLWVTDARGRGEPFFGSDRFHFVYKFLGLPYQEVTLLPPARASGEKGKL